MRISTSYQFSTYSNNIAKSQEKYMSTQNAVMTGKRISKMSDDPYGTAKSLSMRTLKSAATQYGKNLSVAKNSLSYTEASLGDVHGILRDAYQVALQAANDTTDQSARNALAVQVDGIQQQLLQLANSQGPSNEYIFGGQTNTAKPFVVSSTAGANSLALSSGLYLNFNGDNLDVVVESGPGDTLAINTKAESIFKDAYEALDQLKVDLQSGNVSSLGGTDIEKLQDSMDQFNTERGVVGTKLQTVSMLSDHYTRRVDELKSGISDVEEVDLAEAIQQYQLAKNVYNAALSVASKGYDLSLMDFIN
jgi:flagellar hook-associated protein 3 FlgL